MLILLVVCLLFVWLIVRELNSPKELDTFSKSYIAVLTVFALLTGYPYLDQWRFESLLSKNATQLADNRTAKVRCITVFESVYDKFGISGTGNPATGDIVLKYPICDNLREYLKSPETASIEAISSLHAFTREAMYVRGETDEKKRDCQAIQRNVNAAKFLGILTHIAEQNSNAYYNGPYQKHALFSEKCAKGKEFDEDLLGSVW